MKGSLSEREEGKEEGIEKRSGGRKRKKEKKRSGKKGRRKEGEREDKRGDSAFKDYTAPTART